MAQPLYTVNSLSLVIHLLVLLVLKISDTLKKLEHYIHHHIGHSPS